MTDSLVAVGSQSHVSLVDPRRKAPVREVESLDHSHGAPAAAGTACRMRQYIVGTTEVPHARAAAHWMHSVCLACCEHSPKECSPCGSSTSVTVLGRYFSWQKRQQQQIFSRDLQAPERSDLRVGVQWDCSRGLSRARA